MRFDAFESVLRTEQKSVVQYRIQDGGHQPEVTELRGFRIGERPTLCISISGTYSSANYERISMRILAFKSAANRQCKATVTVSTTTWRTRTESHESTWFSHRWTSN
jgi:hypothetical protein